MKKSATSSNLQGSSADSQHPNVLAARIYGRGENPKARLSSSSPNVPNLTGQKRSLNAHSGQVSGLGLAPVIRTKAGLSHSQSAPDIHRSRVKLKRLPNNEKQKSDDICVLLQPLAFATPKTLKESSAGCSEDLKIKNNNNSLELMTPKNNDPIQIRLTEEECKLEDSSMSIRKRGQDGEKSEGSKSFIDSLRLDSKRLEELQNGNFAYLRPTPGSVMCSVYELEVCKHSDTNPADYFTLSKDGVTHFTSTQAEFTRIEDWEREYETFYRIQKISFFAKFRLFKNFRTWKLNVKRGNMTHSAEILEKKLFTLNQQLSSSLLEIREMCSQISSAYLIFIDEYKTWELEEFVNAQQIHRGKIQNKIIEFTDNVRICVRNACDMVLDEFLAENGIVADHKMTFMERAALRTECRKLARFIQLVDFQVAHTLIVLSNESQYKLWKLIKPDILPEKKVLIEEEKEEKVVIKTKNNTKEAIPAFKVAVTFDTNTGDLNFSPSLDDYKLMLEQVIVQSVGLISSADRLLYHEELAPYTQVANKENDIIGRDEVELDTIVLQQVEFLEVKARIHKDMESAMEEAKRYSEVFIPYRDVFLENSTKQENSVTEFRTTEIKIFEDLIEQFRGQENEFGGIPLSADIGIIKVNSEELKQALIPSPHLCLEAVRAVIPKIMALEASELIEELGNHNLTVNREPESVKEFTEKCDFLASSAEFLPLLQDRFSRIKQLGRLLESSGWNIPDEESVSIKMISDELNKLQDNIQTCEARKDEDTSRFIKKLQAEVPKIEKEIVLIREKLDDPRIADAKSNLLQMLEYLDTQTNRMEKTKSDIEELQGNQAYLDLGVSEFELVDEVAADLKIKSDLWHGIDSWNKLQMAWINTEFKDLDADEMDREIKLHSKTAFKATKGLHGSTAAPMLKDKVDEVKGVLPVVTSLRSSSLQERHWKQIHETAGFEILGVEGFTLGKLIENKLEEKAEEIQAIAVASAQEMVLEEMIAKIANIWKTTEIELNDYKEQKDVYILGGVEEIITNLDDSLVTISTIMGSRFVAGIKNEVDSWRKRLVLFQETLDEWLLCQRGWMYLETIFSAPDIQRQLPVESKKFFAVDTFWKNLMKRTSENPNAIKACTATGLCAKFKECNEYLDKIQKSLEDYLETKRAAFPRFYFLANDELLEILAQTKDPQAVQPHLRKCFDALVQLDFGSKPKSIDIEAMISPEGERIELGKNLKARGNVEDWLTAVENHMRTSLQKLMKIGLQDYPQHARKDWVLLHPGQIVATVAQMTWVQGTEAALRSQNAIEKMKAWYQTNLDELRELIIHIRGDLTKRQRKVIVALVTTDVHARDIIEKLKNDQVSEVNNFNWQMQLRYYWDEDVDDCRVRHSDAVIEFGYEYQGCTSRLVITPLTDRCWMTITGSYGLKLGAAPAGPAGTGKTESSKDLAKALGVQCIVFNCSDQIDYKMMGKLFRGLAQCGSWTCLDEFNRIDIEVLSVVAQQLLTLRQGRLEGKSRIIFMGVDILLKDHHVIVTMNPGYAGRTELPDNLKVCFRPVAMMVPDYALIAEIMLFAEGFGDANTLSRKMIKLFHLSSQQLSQQPHYDYGLRAVKSVLVMAGGLKRASPDVGEDVTLIRALQDSNIPKCLAEDLPLFHAIVKDLFPGVYIPEHDYGEFQVAIEEEIAKANLQPVPKFITKVIQQFDIFNIRFGATIVGPTGAGKTTCYRILKAAMGNMRDRGSADGRYQYVEETVLNPKCITMGELYGEFNELTQEWHDGLASTIMRKAVTDCDGTDLTKRWTVFDGPIDALWIENMNTVLDDNMTLCLANGERIKLKVEMKCLFEVQDLAQASPATVSRLGVMYMSPDDLGWRAPVETWLNTRLPKDTPEWAIDYIRSNFESFVDEGLKYVRRNGTEPVETLNGGLVAGLMFLFESLFKPENGVRIWDNDEWLQLAQPEGVQPDEHLKILGEADGKQVIDKLFIFSLVWSIGGSITSNGWEGFDKMLRETIEREGKKVNIPGKGFVYDYLVECRMPSGAEWIDFKERIPEFAYDKDLPYFKLLVPNVDTTRYSYVMRQLMLVHRPVFLTGVSGTGKTSAINDMLSRASALPDESKDGLGVVPLFINFSAQTSSMVTQATIEGKLEKKRKTLLGAPAGRRVVVFVDDINMPFVEEYGAQAPVELLRQFLDMKGFYDRDKLFWKDVENTMLMTAAAPPGGGRNPVTPRFKRHFNVICMTPASSATMEHIFISILRGHLASFSVDAIKSLAEPVVKSVVEIFTKITSELLPTPAKSHYTFNLRDVSKVFQGILNLSNKRCPDVDTFSKVFCHESMRVFYDRLINTEDQRWFTELLVQLMNRHLKLTCTHEGLFESEWPILFCDFLRPGVAPEDRLYEQVKDTGKLLSVLDDNLDEYNISNPTQMNLVFFKAAVEHISRIVRIVRQPRGNAMLIGVGGSGKQSCTRLAAFMCEYKCFQIELVRGYGKNEFHEDMRELMIQTGQKGENVVFLFTDSQIIEEGFLEDINNILNSGEIPNLFPSEDMDRVLNEMLPVCKSMGIPETRDNCRSTFISRVRDNLHIVLCMSPVGDSLRVRCRNFPSLINCTTIDWYMEWPKSALTDVATRFLSDMDVSDEIKESLVTLCGEIHTSVVNVSGSFWEQLRRKVYTTPKSYLDLIALYLSMYEEKQKQLVEIENRMKVGVEKLNDTNTIVDDLKEELKKLQPVLVEKAKETEELIARVEVDKKEAAIVEEKVSKDEQVVSKQAEEVQAIQADAQKDLDVAMPALNKALKALNALDKKDITEIKSFAKPPPAVQTVMEAVCILLGKKPDWDTAKKLLGDAKFMESLRNYDKDNIPPATLKKLKKYVQDPNMSVETVQKVSKAATSMCMFCHAMDIYSEVAKVVAPKKAALEEMNQKLKAANDLLAEKQSELQAVRDKVAALEKTLNDTLKAKQDLEDQSELTKARLVRAGKLTSGLAEEGVRWKATLANTAVEKELLIGNVMVSAGCISYFGAFTGKFRQMLVNKWIARVKELKIPGSDNFSLQATMGNPVQTREWQINGLPTDDVSADSAVLVTRGKRWPLMIDPQMQANKWIKNTEASNQLEIIKMNNPNLLRSLENAIRVGRPLLVEDVHEFLDPALDPVLQKATFEQGGRTLIHLGDSDIDYDPNFKFYMTTKLPNPHYLPEVCIKVTVINFTVTFTGLTDQLLGDVVVAERPDIEEKKNKLVVSMAADAKQLKDLEAKILQMLSESKGNILDDEVLIETLSDSKATSIAINKRVEESKATQKVIEEARASYRAVAIRGALLYFVIADLAQIDPMYQYSLTFFAAMFNECLRSTPDRPDLESRLIELKKYQTEVIFTTVSRGLFETHKSLFAALICFQILIEAEIITRGEFALFLRGCGVIDRSEMPENPGGETAYFTDAQWDNLCAMDRDIKRKQELGEHDEEEADGTNKEDKSFRPFEGLTNSICNNWESWMEWANGKSPYSETYPDGFDKLNDFHKLMVVNIFRPELTLQGLTKFVEAKIGRNFVEFPPVSMADVFNGTNKFTPCIFVLSQGADPTNMLLKFAKEKEYGERLGVISLGQGQGAHAQRLITESCRTGDWVLLQNCHLAKSWMPALEKIVLDLEENQDEINDDFRLWLTSFPANYFPVTVLQNGIKLTNEPPKGIRANMIRSFDGLISESEWETCKQSLPWKKLVVGLSFFHAIVQERRKFGPLGWNIRYEFNDTDLETSLSVLRRFLDQQDSVPWDALSYVSGQINYGGRVTDDWDRRCLMGILQKFCNPGILEPGYLFSSSEQYYAPEDCSFSDVVTYLKNLPMIDTPDVFGMHNNAEITFQQAESTYMINTMLALQPRETGGGDVKSSDDIVLDIIAEITGQVPVFLDTEKAGPNTFIILETGLISSLDTVLSQEIVKFNVLTRRMISTLEELEKAIKGLVVMSLDLDKMYNSFLLNQVPDLWSVVGFASRKSLMSWVEDLRFRVAFLEKWLLEGQPNAFPLQAFFFPQGFMTGTLQTHARKYQVAVDELSFTYDTLKGEPEDITEPPDDGVIVYGMWMEGARFNRDTEEIDDSLPGQIYTMLPPILMIPAINHKPPPEKYQCPVYKTSVRQGVLSTTGMSTNFVVPLELSTSKDPNTWVMTGCAALLNLDT